MLKGRRTKVVILIIACLLIVSVSPIFFINLRGEFDEQENKPAYFNSNLFMVSLWTPNSITGILYEDFDPFNVESSTFNNFDLEINLTITTSLIILIGTSVGVQLFDLIKNESQKGVQDKEVASIPITSDLSIEESQVLALVEEFLNQNRVCYKPDLVSFIKSRNFQEDNGLNHNGIKHTLDSLVAKHMIVEGSKITRNTTLSNLNRSSVYEEIKNNPGMYLNKLSKDLGLSTFLTNWHLNILLRFNMIRKQEFNNQIAYFDSELPSENDYILQIISRAKCSELIEYLKLNSNGCTKSQIAKTLRMHHTTVNKYLEIIIDNQLANLQTVNNKSLYYLNTEKFDELKNLR
jgi:predicted transcriptional regulator